ncbi:hypothetical protein DNTS_028656 [Danionella cerebrum]|uniref:Uncharacterized protein n=1 Tax=Danionella cerebrum TaxID=2873325 RepID=A0A553QA77_9TELE|nr:hypothetical protein DNTS_028656 [Danionella translucida]
MDLLREHFWAVLLMVITVASLLIIIAFIILHVCIHESVSKFNITATPNQHSEKKNSSENQRNSDENPPLPSRDQFLTTSDVNLGSASNYVNRQQPSVTERHSKVQKKTEDQDSEDYDDIENPSNDSNVYDDVL